MDELQKRQRQLEADQKDWAARKLLIQDEITRGNATLDALVPKVADTRSELEGLRAEVAEVHRLKPALEAETAGQQAVRDTVVNEIAERRRELADLDALILARQGQVDDDMVAYRRKMESAVRTELVELETSTRTKREEADSLQTQLDQKREELNSILESITQHRATAHQERSEANESLTQLRGQVPELEAKVTLLEGKFKQASYQLKQVLAETEKATREHQAFIEYEARAKKILVAKDRELQDKRDELEVTARYTNNRRSYLPEL